MAVLDFSALASPVSRQDLTTFRDTPGVVGSAWKGTAALFEAIAIILVAAIAVLFAGQAIWSAISAHNVENLPLSLGFLVVAGIIVWVVLLVRRASRIRLVRIYRFAIANGLDFTANTDVPDYPGAIFNIGTDATITESLARPAAPAVSIGDLKYSTGSGKSRTIHQWGFVAMKLDRMLPQMILDAKANNFLGTNLPITFSRDQVLDLEGDFDRHFTLYCPKQYERDALYVFTPDFMAQLVDEAALFDVEIVDDWMFLYSAKPFDLADPVTLKRVFRIVDTVGSKAIDRTERYSDSTVDGGSANRAAGSPLVARMAANVVSPQGQRLRKGVSVATVIGFVAIAIYGIATFLPDAYRF